MKNKILYSLIFCGLTTGVIHAQRFNFDDIFQDMQERMNEMHKEIHEMEKLFAQQFKSMQKDSTQTIAQPTIKESNNQITITFKDITTAPTQAIVQDEDNQLTIKTDTQTIKIRTEKTLLSISIDQYIKRKNKKDKQQAIQSFYRSSSLVKTLNKSVELNNVVVDYNNETRQLIITIPTQEEKKGKAIPINIKRNNKKVDKSNQKF